PDGGMVVDLEREVRLEVAEGIVGEGRQVKHGLATGQVGQRDVPYVLADGGNAAQAGIRSECTTAVEVAVQPDDFVAAGQKHGDEDGADVPEVSGDKDAHS